MKYGHGKMKGYSKGGDMGGDSVKLSAKGTEGRSNEEPARKVAGGGPESATSGQSASGGRGSPGLGKAKNRGGKGYGRGSRGVSGIS